jgi:hypothetical protein
MRSLRHVTIRRGLAVVALAMGALLAVSGVAPAAHAHSVASAPGDTNWG